MTAIEATQNSMAAIKAASSAAGAIKDLLPVNNGEVCDDLMVEGMWDEFGLGEELTPGPSTTTPSPSTTTSPNSPPPQYPSYLCHPGPECLHMGCNY